jgi:NADH-quinone oxidoreductase subunit B
MNGRRERSNGIDRPTHPGGACAQGDHRSQYRSGKPVGWDDPFFGEINNELADKGFLVTSTDELINWARTGSLMWMTFGLACCAVEMMQMSMPRYDAERFGFAPRAQPAPVRRDDRCRHADQQDGAGSAQGLRPDARAALRDLDGLLRQWRRLLSLFLFGGARLRPGGAGGHLRPGCPPTAEALLYGVLLLQKKMRRTGTIERYADLTAQRSQMADVIRANRMMRLANWPRRSKRASKSDRRGDVDVAYGDLT